MRFSERMGFKPVTLELQTDSMSRELRNSLWNTLHAIHINDRNKSPHQSYSPRLHRLAVDAQVSFFKLPVDDIEDYDFSYIARVKTWVLKTDFHQLYDFIEWLAEWDSANSVFVDTINSVLEREHSSYRLVGGVLTPITNTIEIESVELASSHGGKFGNVSAHIQAAIKLFSDKKAPDYRNSIKEAISAVEAAARTLSGSEKATLGDALKDLEKRKKLHPALKEGFLKIYGYSSDADGIRHAMSDMPTTTEADARFMLVSCSAFCQFFDRKLAEDR